MYAQRNYTTKKYAVIEKNVRYKRAAYRGSATTCDALNGPFVSALPSKCRKQNGAPRRAKWRAAQSDPDPDRPFGIRDSSREWIRLGLWFLESHQASDGASFPWARISVLYRNVFFNNVFMFNYLETSWPYYLTNFAHFGRLLFLLFTGGSGRLDNICGFHHMTHHAIYGIVDHCRIVHHIVDGLANIIDHIVAVVDDIAILQTQVGIVSVGYTCDIPTWRVYKYRLGWKIDQYKIYVTRTRVNSRRWTDNCFFLDCLRVLEKVLDGNGQRGG